MWRAPLVFFAILFITYLQFQYFPGHSYLAAASQLYLPVLEHLSAPGYLSRDLVASHPNVSYTIYDELTLFLHQAAKLSFYHALLLQQFVCRWAALGGLYLLARAAGLRRIVALTVAAIVCLGTLLPGVDTWLIDPEPVPRAFAFGLLLLAMGCLARQKPLLAGLFAGVALLFDPLIASFFWLALISGFALNRRLRKLLRPTAPILVVFVLLLANLAQLQQGPPDSQDFFTRLSGEVAAISRFRSPDLWITLWPAQFIYFYLALFVICVWALTRIWPTLNSVTRWMLLLLPFFGILSLPVSGLLLDHYGWSSILRWQPMQMLVYTVAALLWACLLASLHAFAIGARREAVVWAAVSVSVLAFNFKNRPAYRPDSSVTALADWAETNTWGSSVFLFPDAGRDLSPGRFRGQSRRALWVDWESGRQMNYDPSLAAEWFTRWKLTMTGPLSGSTLERMLALPIDYFVFEHNCALQSLVSNDLRPITSVFRNERFCVYEASTLRALPGTLLLSPGGPGQSPPPPLSRSN
jgi:hypothetical protein